MKRENWVWMPHPGHFICARDCQFHLNTYVGGYIVSTVGELWPERSSRDIHAKVYDPAWYAENKHLKGDTYDAAYFKRFGWEKLGASGTYETMVFKAIRATGDEGSVCCPWRIQSGTELTCERYDDADAAAKGHRLLCEKWSKGKAKP